MALKEEVKGELKAIRDQMNQMIQMMRDLTLTQSWAPLSQDS